MFDQDQYTTDEPQADEFGVEVEDVTLDEVDAPSEADAPVATEADKPKAEKVKKPARPEVPEGYVAPVAWAKELSARLTEEGRKSGALTADQEIVIPPQYVYSAINQGRKPNAKHPLVSYSEGGRDNLLKRDEANAWWEAKEARKNERATAVKTVVKKDETKVEDTTPVVEAE